MASAVGWGKRSEPLRGRLVALGDLMFPGAGHRYAHPNLRVTRRVGGYAYCAMPLPNDQFSFDTSTRTPAQRLQAWRSELSAISEIPRSADTQVVETPVARPRMRM